MSKAYEFLKECGIFYVLTMNGDYPAGRPFGVVMEEHDDLYIATNDRNQAHKQLCENGHVQLIAKKPQGREWIRITGTASECHDATLRQKMYDENKILQMHHKTSESEHFLMFRIIVENVEFK